MPAVRGVYNVHPDTGVPGVWVALTEDGIVGSPSSTYEGLLDPSWDLATASANATAYAQSIVGPSVAVVVTVTQLSPLLFGFEVSNPPGSA